MAIPAQHRHIYTRSHFTITNTFQDYTTAKNPLTNSYVQQQCQINEGNNIKLQMNNQNTEDFRKTFKLLS